MSEDVISGTVKFFNIEKGFGFLQVPGTSTDVFVHANQLRKSGIDKSLVQGEKVRFCVESGPKGNFATKIMRGDA